MTANECHGPTDADADRGGALEHGSASDGGNPGEVSPARETATVAVDGPLFVGPQDDLRKGTAQTPPFDREPYPWELAPPAPRRSLGSVVTWVAARFLHHDPTFSSLFGPLAVLALILYSRWPGTNYIFDEQEALLANPYVNATGGLRYIDAIHRDFWGLPPDHSIGSYRPIPDFFWRALWRLSSTSEGVFRQPFLHHIYNVFFHAANATLIALVVFAWTHRRRQAVLAGMIFTACAVLTEAVSGIVGIADELGGLGALLALAALTLPAWAMPFAVFTAVVFGLFSKESALVCVPLVPFAALVAAPLTHPERPARMVRAISAFVGAAAAFYLYVELRKRWFPSPLPAELNEELPADADMLQRLFRSFLLWFHQAPLPRDPLNNPLIDADIAHRIAGALRVYTRGLKQLVLPYPLSGDYSYPQEPVPDRLVFPESVAGALLTVGPFLGSAACAGVALVREARERRWARPMVADAANNPGRSLRLVGLLLVLVDLLFVGKVVFWGNEPAAVVSWRGIPAWVAAIPVALLGIGLVVEGLPPRRGFHRTTTCSSPILVAVGLVWIVVSYFPHSNIPVLLPTVRAERFWYFPAIGSTLVFCVGWDTALGVSRRRWLRLLAASAFGVFFLGQCFFAYRHAMDYRTDLDFWQATKNAVPRSAKAHLNYSVMKGARGDLQTRLVESRIALDLAPRWPMAHVYTGDTLCRLHRAEEAWPYYRDGFELGPNDLGLIALALQCLYDEGALLTHEDELRDLAAGHEGSWLAYLATDTLANYEKNKGVDPKHRPRGYNEGPKE